MTERILVTSALPYVGATKHVGNLAGSLLPADVLARHHRRAGREVLFTCATDEHGTPAELAAAKAGLDPAAFCTARHAEQAATYAAYGLSFDHFGRTSSPANHALTQHLYRRLDAAGLIAEREVEQVWSGADGRFLPDRFVTGTCPHCRAENARGDQCDACSALLDPVDLIDPRSAISGSRDLSRRTSRHLFLRQSALVGALDGWLATRHGWPQFALSLARSLVGPDLRDRCITRDLSWGVPVPRPGYEGKVFYVWFDAPVAYLAGVREWASTAPGRDWRDWIVDRGDGATRWIQCLGKDNVPFHAVSFPATLVGSGEPWKTADVIKAFHWVVHRDGKFSTSGGRGVFLDEALDAAPADAWRWWLSANSPESADVEFAGARFADDVNKDLADTLGNLARRTCSLLASAHGGAVPGGGEPSALDREAAASAAGLAAEASDHLDANEVRKAAKATRALWVVANAHLQAAAPWTARKSDPAAAEASLRTSTGLVELAAAAAWPFVPDLASGLLARLGCGVPATGPSLPDADSVLSGERAGRRTEVGPPPFAKVDVSTRAW